MTAPLAIGHRVALVELGRALADVLASAAERQATDTAASSRPPCVGDRRTNNEAAPAPASNRDGFAEDDREAVTTDKHAV